MLISALSDILYGSLSDLINSWANLASVLG